MTKFVPPISCYMQAVTYAKHTGTVCEQLKVFIMIYQHGAGMLWSSAQDLCICHIGYHG